MCLISIISIETPAINGIGFVLQEPQETMPLTAFLDRRRLGNVSPPRYVPPYGSPATLVSIFRITNFKFINQYYG